MGLNRSNNIISLGLMLILLCTFAIGARGDDDLPNEDSSPALATQASAKPDGANAEDLNKAYKESEITPKPFDRKVWNEKKKGLNYTQKELPKEKEVDKTEGDNQSNGNNRSNSSNSGSNFSLNFGPFGQFLLVAVVIAVLALIVFVLVKMGFLESNTRIAQSNQGPVLLEQIEDNLHESDLEKALRLALDAKDYRMAIRLYYLTIIKELSLRDWIKWKRDKTNGQYVREMVDKPEGKNFRTLTTAFERAWYSDEEIVLKHYEVLSPQFQSFISSLKKR